MSRSIFSTDRHGWAELLPPHTPTAAISGTRRCHWAVVGAGFTGLACARRLAELHPEQDIILLDARALAQAASGRNSGYAVGCSHFPGAFDPTRLANYQRVNRINAAGLALLREQVQQLGIDCQWREQGFFHAAADVRALVEVPHFADYLNRLAIPHRVLAQAELQEQLGTGWYRQAVQVPIGALVQPAALLYGLATTLPSNVSLHENSPVLRVDTGAGITLHTPDAVIATERLMIAANFEAATLGLIRPETVGSTLSGSFTRQLTADERAGLGELDQWGVLSLHSGGATVRLTEDGRISVRNTAEYHGGRLLSDAALHQRRLIHRQAFENRFPQLRAVPFEFSWSGVEGISRNGTNFFQNPRRNVWFAGGYNGSGISRGTAFGTALADYASGGQSTLITDCLGSPKAQWLPPRPILDLGVWLTVRKRFRGVGRDR
ncbi:MAG TPA: FAD-binding oxidoreductase [Thiolinea sp.]|nr:FAD-binding oxidoreductase [Thiolinea sp.]